MGLGDLTKALATLTVSIDSFAIEFERPAPDVPAFQARPSHTAADALDDQ